MIDRFDSFDRPHSLDQLGDRLRQEFQGLLGSDLTHKLIPQGIGASDFSAWSSLEQSIHEALQIVADLMALEQQLTSGFFPIEDAPTQTLLNYRGPEQDGRRPQQTDGQNTVGQQAGWQVPSPTDTASVASSSQRFNDFPFAALPPSLQRPWLTDSNPRLGHSSFDHQSLSSQLTNSRAFTDQPLSDQPVDNRSIDSKSLGDRSINSHSFTEPSLSGQSINNRSIDSEPWDNRSINSQPTDQFLGNQSLGDRSINSHSFTEPSFSDQSISSHSIDSHPQPWDDRSISSHSFTEPSFSDQSINSRSIDSEPWDDRSINSHSFTDQSFSEQRFIDSQPQSLGNQSVNRRSFANQSISSHSIASHPQPWDDRSISSHSFTEPSFSEQHFIDSQPQSLENQSVNRRSFANQSISSHSIDSHPQPWDDRSINSQPLDSESWDNQLLDSTPLNITSSNTLLSQITPSGIPPSNTRLSSYSLNHSVSEHPATPSYGGASHRRATSHELVNKLVHESAHEPGSFRSTSYESVSNIVLSQSTSPTLGDYSPALEELEDVQRHILSIQGSELGASEDREFPTLRSETSNTQASARRVIRGLRAVAEVLETHPSELLGDSLHPDHLSADDLIDYSTSHPASYLDEYLADYSTDLRADHPADNPSIALPYPQGQQVTLARNNTFNSNSATPIVDRQQSHSPYSKNWSERFNSENFHESELDPNLANDQAPSTNGSLSANSNYGAIENTAFPLAASPPEFPLRTVPLESNQFSPATQQQHNAALELLVQRHSELDLDQILDAISREIAREYRYFYGD